MNTYAKWCPNVYVAKCPEKHEKGEEIELTTKYGGTHDCIVWNYLGTGRDGLHYYSVTRADGFDAQERAKAKALRLECYAANAEKRSEQAYQASHEGRDFLALGEPIKIGHHSERRHRALIERNHNRMRRCVEESERAKDYASRAAYWESRAEHVNLSMPESIEYYAHKLEEATEHHKALKEDPALRSHGMSLQYANKAKKEAESNLKMARKLWGDESEVSA